MTTKIQPPAVEPPVEPPAVEPPVEPPVVEPPVEPPAVEPPVVEPLEALGAARAELDQVRAELEQERARAASLDQVRAELEQERARAASLEQERGLWGLGYTDDEALDQVRHSFERVPEADRPQGGIVAWASSLTPETAPRALRPFLEAEQLPPPPPPRAPGPNDGTVPRADPVGQPATVAAIAACRARCQASGDWSEWVTMRTALSAARAGKGRPPR